MYTFTHQLICFIPDLLRYHSVVLHNDTDDDQKVRQLESVFANTTAVCKGFKDDSRTYLGTFFRENTVA